MTVTSPRFLTSLAVALSVAAGSTAAAQTIVAPPVTTQTPATPAAGTPTTAAPPVPAATALPVIPRWARVSFFGHGASTNPVDGDSSTFSELTTTVSAQSAQRADGGLVYGLDVRFGAYPSSEDRDQRVSVYDAYVGQRLMGGRLFVKAGQMWLNDLGALGSVGGGLVEFSEDPHHSGLRWRVGAFGGVEPKILEAGYVSGVTKFGAYAALDGQGARKHVLGYVNVRNESLTERSVITMTNYIPVGQKLFVYQAAEVDLTGPGGEGSGDLSYFFVNARITPVRRADLQLTYHRGRSVDARSITEDILNGRPVSAKMLDGYLFESWNGRVTVDVFKNVHAFVGYGQDKGDSASAATNRVSFGVYSGNLFGTGVDLNVTDYRYSSGSASSYDSWYVSLGRSVGSRAYLTAEYTSSLSVVRFTPSDGVTIETRPSTDRFGGSVMLYLTRSMSFYLTGEHTRDDNYSENRVLTGLTYRF